MSTINTHQGKNIEGGWIIYRNSINAFRTVLTGLDTSAIVFSMEFYTPGGTTPKLTLTESTGITNDDAGTIDYSLSVANLATLPRDRYFFVIKYTVAGATYPLAQGYTNITSETNPGTTLTSVTIPVSVSSTQINMTVTMTGGSGGGGTWGSIIGTLSDQTDLQAALDALEALTIVSITGVTSLTSTAFGNFPHICTGTTTDYTVDLPTAVGNSGGVVTIKGSSSLTKVVTIQGVSGQLIDGESDRKLSTCGLLVLMSDGANWVVVNEVGSWIPYTPIWSGFAVDPTITRADYFRQGKTCTARVLINGSGTSNATTFTVTIPFTCAEVTYANTILVVNGGTLQTTPGLAATRVGQNTVDMYRTNDITTTWTNTGNKRATLLITFRIP